MRKIKELLALMLEHQELFKGGLCHWVGGMYVRGLINEFESRNLRNYISENKPSRFSSWSAYKGQKKSNNAFYWERGNIKPRIKWIKKHIKKNNK